MAKQVDWNKPIVEKFAELAMLSELEIDILETRIRGMTITQQSRNFGMSESTVSRVIKNLKKKYDLVQPLCPDVLPVRRNSREEMFMDTN